MKALKILLVLVSLTFAMGCNLTASNCQGLVNYDASEWSVDDIAAMQTAVDAINNWIGSESVYLHKAFDHEIKDNRCMIHPESSTNELTDKQSGFHSALSGNIVIARDDIMNRAKSYQKGLDRMSSVMAHELMHGLGFEHVEGKENVMYYQGNASLEFGSNDRIECQNQGYCN